jgi:hypothetical protein
MVFDKVHSIYRENEKASRPEMLPDKVAFALSKCPRNIYCAFAFDTRYSEFLHRLATVCLNRLWQRLYITQEEKRTGKMVLQFGCPMPKKANSV